MTVGMGICYQVGGGVVGAHSGHRLGSAGKKSSPLKPAPAGPSPWRMISPPKGRCG